MTATTRATPSATTTTTTAPTDTRTNWKNVGNWHWTTKNCSKWAKEYFEKHLPGLSATDGSATVELVRVVSVGGDADLNQRKGKVTALFDLELELEWTGKEKDGKEAKGRLTIPEVAYDTDEYVFDTNGSNDMRALIRSRLREKVEKVLRDFSKAVVDENIHDVKIAAGELREPAVVESPGPKRVEQDVDSKVDPHSGTPVATSSAAVSADGGSVLNTSTLTQTMEFVCPIESLFAALSQDALISRWSRSPVRRPSDTGKYYLFNGHIEVIELEKGAPTRLVWLWRTAQWPQGHYSTVTIELAQGESATRLSLKQEGVPKGTEGDVKENWGRYYWRPIKQTFGFGAFL